MCSFATLLRVKDSVCVNTGFAPVCEGVGHI